MAQQVGTDSDHNEGTPATPRVFDALAVQRFALNCCDGLKTVKYLLM